MYLLDSQFLDDPTKYFSGVLAALSAMVNLEIPHVNVMTKMDLVVSAFVLPTSVLLFGRRDQRLFMSMFMIGIAPCVDR